MEALGSFARNTGSAGALLRRFSFEYFESSSFDLSFSLSFEYFESKLVSFDYFERF